jgi:hypothetical protein
MLIIKFHWGRALDLVRDDTGMYAVNTDGFMAMQPYERDTPEPDAFLGGVQLVGIASLKNKNIVYRFNEITQELLDQKIYGLNSDSCTEPQYTIIVKELGNTSLWSRGIEKLYFVNY